MFPYSASHFSCACWDEHCPCDCFSCSVGTLHGRVLHHRDNHICRSLLLQNWWPTSIMLSLLSQFPQLTSSCWCLSFHSRASSPWRLPATGSFFFISLQVRWRADFRERWCWKQQWVSALKEKHEVVHSYSISRLCRTLAARREGTVGLVAAAVRNSQGYGFSRPSSAGGGQGGSQGDKGC